MEILETRVYRGPNLYALWPMIRLEVDLGELEDYPTMKLPGFTERLLDLMPTLAEHTCGLGVPGGLVARMTEEEGTWLGHVLEHVAIELQCLAGTWVTFGKTRQESLPKGQYYVVYSYGEEAVGLAAGRLALRLIRCLLPPEREDHDPSPFDFRRELEGLVRLAQRHAMDPTTAALVRAAEERGIPWMRLDDRSLVQLGHGKYQRRIQASITSETRQIAVEIASDKHLTRRILEDLGLPVPHQVQPGNDYRILVVGGRVVAVTQRSTGGTAIDRTDAIHEDNRVMAERAVQAIGLDVGGVDFLSPDIGRSYKDVGGAIVEINAAPGFRMHVAPTEGTPRDVAGPVLDMLFPKGVPCRIPIAAVTGTNGKTTTTRMVGHILGQAGYTVGMATTEGVYIGGVLAVRGDMTGPWSSQLVLRDPRVDAAVLETARGGIVRSGLGWRKCSVGAVLNVQCDHLGLGGITTLDELAAVKRVVVEVAQDFCVLNADDPRVAAMAEHSPGEPIYVTMDYHSALVRRHIRQRKRAVVLEEGLNGPMLLLYQGEEQIALLSAHQIPAAMEGAAIHNVQNAMFAAAITCGLGVGVEAIREGLRTFANDFTQAPGRLNVYHGHRVPESDAEVRKEAPVHEELLAEAATGGRRGS
jgi:hypothetical protein